MFGTILTVFIKGQTPIIQPISQSGTYCNKVQVALKCYCKIYLSLIRFKIHVKTRGPSETSEVVKATTNMLP